MTNPEKSLAEQTTLNESATDNKILGYAEVFCRAMTQLNAVALGQIEGLLNIAVQAAEKYRSINPSAVVAAPSKTEEFSEFTIQLKSVADKINRTNQEKALTVEQAAVQTAPNPDAVLAVIERALGNAIENSASNQQALNEMGAAILARSASLLLSADGGGASKPAVENG